MSSPKEKLSSLPSSARTIVSAMQAYTTPRDSPMSTLNSGWPGSFTRPPSTTTTSSHECLAFDMFFGTDTSATML